MFSSDWQAAYIVAFTCNRAAENGVTDAAIHMKGVRL